MGKICFAFLEQVADIFGRVRIAPGCFVGVEHTPNNRLLLDLRLLGWVLPRVPASEMARRLVPWMKAGFAVMIITGALLFYGIPVRYYQNIFFRLKMIALLLAGLNAFIFEIGVRRRTADWDLRPVPPAAARAAGAASLALWAVIIVAGRMIAYNWFDCDKQPQSHFINWATGCEPDASGVSSLQ